MGNVLKADHFNETPRRNPCDVLDPGAQLRQALGQQLQRPSRGQPLLGRRETLLLGLLALTLHGAVLHWLASRPEPVLPEVPVQVPPMTIEFAAPPPPEPVIE